MKIVNATWELRNLGVRALEVNLDAYDSPDSISTVFNDFGSGYIVARVPTGLAELTCKLQEMGFIFAETMFHFSHLGGGFELNRVQERIFKRSFSQKMSLLEIQSFIRQVKDGIFYKDRISLDAKFGPDVANQRYANWIQDEVSNGADVYFVIVNRLRVGFFALKKKDRGEYFLFLSGLFPRYHTSGLGFCPHFLGIAQGLRNGAKRVRLAVSTNNKGAMTLHVGKGHVVDEIFHVFVKHQ